MFSLLKNIFSRRKIAPHKDIDPDEIFLDSSNLPRFDRFQFEGRIEKPISKRTVFFVGGTFVLVAIILLSKIWSLEISQGAYYVAKASNNMLRYSLVFAKRGVIYDRNGAVLAENIPDDSHPEFPKRKYDGAPGLSNILGYIQYPSKDNFGFYYRQDYQGQGGMEKIFNDLLAGQNGLKIVEVDALGKLQSESVIQNPVDGANIHLSIDKQIQNKLYEFIGKTANEIGFDGGAVAIMDINSGELLAMASYPEYDSSIMSEGDDRKAIAAFVADKRRPFLNKVSDGLYTPGSIVKPFLAMGVLQEKLIDPLTKILSTGSISIPNPFAPEKKSTFTDWRPQGWVDMRDALSVSSNVYFYEVGGGFETQPGLGIDRIGKYMRMFGFGEEVSNGIFSDKIGTIPSPAWKAENFKDSEWRIGDTYNTSIGQYGVQITPLQAVKAVAAIANGGKLIEPTIIQNGNDLNSVSELSLDPQNYQVVREGMRQAVLSGTAKNLDIPQVAIAAKTGTAEIGTLKKKVNSWIIGFYPYENPKYAFVAMMEAGPHDNTIGALYVMRQLFEWMGANTPEYLK